MSFSSWVALLALSPEVAVEWTAPQECPAVEIVHERVAARVQPGSAQGATATLVVAAIDPRYVLTLDLAIPGGAPTHRVIDAASCEELVDAAALVIAVAIDPVFVTIDADVAEIVAEVEPASIAPPQLPEPSPSIAPSPVEPDPPPRAREPLRVGLRASAGGWFGAMPRPAATIAVDLVIPATRLGWAELGALAIPRQRTSVSDSAGADLWLATAVLRGCFAPILRPGTKGLARLRPMACLGVAVGAMGGSSRGAAVSTTGTARELWVSPLFGGGLDVAIARRVGVFARFDGHIHARLPGFHLDGIGPVHRVGPGSVTALVGLQGVLP